MNNIILLLILCFAGTQAKAQTEFITTWKTDNAGISGPTSIIIPTLFGESYTYDVSWKNDGVWENGFTGDAFHDYGTAGTYEVAIRGTFPQIYFDFYSDREKILSIEQWGTNSWSSMAGAFNGCSYLIGNATDSPNLSVVEDMSGMFTDAIAYNEEISDWDVSNVKYMEGTFSGATSFDQNIGAWDVSNVLSMGGMFDGVTLSTANYDALLIGWSNLTLQTGVNFSGGDSKYCYGRIARDKMTSPPFSWSITDGGQLCVPTDYFITTWKTDNPLSGPVAILIPTHPDETYDYDVSWKNDGVWETGFTGDAYHDYGVAGEYTVAIQGAFPRIYFNNSGDRQKILSIEQWGTIEWKSMNNAFNGCDNLIVNAPDTPNLNKVADMSSMFEGATTVDQNIGNWDVGNVNNMSKMFSSATEFNQDIASWEVSNVTNMEGMFENTPFNRNIGNWDVGNVTNMSRMFSQATEFNQDIGNWDVGNTTNMESMFENTPFNRNIGNWDVGNVTNMSRMFSQATEFDQDIGNWDVGNTTNMESMFENTPFNRNIGNWDVGNVINMSRMFSQATGFDQDIGNWDVGNASKMDGMFENTPFNRNIGNWDVGNVTNMSRMFTNATEFDQDIGNWDVSKVTNMTEMFKDVTLSTPNYDALLIGWNTLNLQNGVIFDGGNSKYCNGEDARENMITTFGWIITDGGLSGPLMAICKNITVELDANGNVVITAADVDNGSDLGCTGTAILTVAPNTFNCSNIGANTVTLTVSDANSNTSSCTATVTVVDILPPVVSCPADQTVNPTQFYILPDYFANGEATAIDNCTDPVSITTQDPAPGTSLSDGVYTVTLTASDAYGNTGTCSFVLTVDATMGVGDIGQNLVTITLNPIPTKDILNIHNPRQISLEQLEIYDLIGRLVLTVDLRDMGAIKTINVFRLAAATYSVRIIGKEGQITKRLLKE